MITFQEFLNEASDANIMEEAIVAVWNGDDFNKWTSKVTPEGVSRIVEYLKNNGVSGIAQHLGTGRAEVTDEWKRNSRVDWRTANEPMTI